MTRPDVFISYSHKDELEKDQLLSHLHVLHHAGLIDVWSDDRIGAGADWEAEIREAIAEAEVAILLISANFLTSDFNLTEEVPQLLQRREKEGLIIVPIIAKACAWEPVDWLQKLKVRPRNGTPIWRGDDDHVDEALAAIAQEINLIITGGEEGYRKLQQSLIPADGGPYLINLKGVPLPAHIKSILQAMFDDYQRVVVQQELGAGLSGSRVLQVRPIRQDGHPELPRVIKLAPVGLIEQEWQAFRTHIRDKWRAIAGIEDKPILVEGGDWAGLRYPLLGNSGADQLESLHSYYLHHEIDDIQRILRDRLFKKIEDNWRFSRAMAEYHYQSGYDFLLPVNLMIKPDRPPPNTSVHLLEPNNLPTQPLAAGEYVRLVDFEIIEVEPEKQIVTLNIPRLLDGPPLSYRLRLHSVDAVGHYKVGNFIETPIEGVVTTNRNEMLLAHANKASGQALDLAVETVSWGGDISLPNPLNALAELLQVSRDVMIAAIHGDFNMENILVNLSTNDINVIDFATARQDHAIHDLLRLETEVVSKLLPETIAAAELPIEATVYRFYHQLHQATFSHPELASIPVQPKPGFEKPFKVVAAIRSQARKLLYDEADPREYYQGLALYLLGALKFKNLDMIPYAKQVVFWGAATIISILEEEAVEVGEVWPVPECPYRGLEAFDVEHAGFFFGRERLTQELLTKLHPNTEQDHRFLGIIGPSGSGKSSLVRAGVIAALKRGEIKGSEAWPVVIFKPGTNPLRSLAVALTGVSGFGQGLSDVRDMIKALQEESDALDLAVRLALRESSNDRRLVLVVDQFEEVFTLCQDDSDRQAFFNNLLHAADVPDGQTIVLLTMRADFYGKCAAYPALAKTLSNNQELVGPMSAEELRQAIEKPAHQAGCQFEPGLVALLLNEVKNQPGSLPLMQYALMELWARQEKRRLLRAAYEAMGGVTGVLQQRAETIFSQFNDQEQDVCRRIFLRLTQPGEGTEDTKRRVPLAELLPAEGDMTTVEAVLQTLAGAEARLVTTRRDDELEGQAIEVAHEALIRSWSRLRAWLDENRDAVRIHRRLTEAAEEWVHHNADESYLYVGARLAGAEEWANEHQHDLSALEKTFLQASVDERDRTAAEQEAFRQRELEQTQALAKAASEQAKAEAERARIQASTAKRLRGLVMALAVVFLLAVGAAIFAFTQAQTVQSEANARATAQAIAEIRQEEAEAQTQIARSHALASAAISNLSRDPELSILLALEAMSISQTREAEQVLHRAVQRSRVRRTLPGRDAERTGHTDQIRQVAFNSDGSLLATASEDNTIKLWAVESGQPVLTLSGHVDDVLDVAFSPDGTLLATASEDNSIKLWAVESGQPVLTLSNFTADVQSVSFAPDGTRLAAGSDTVVSVWDVVSGDELLELRLHTDEITDVAYSPDGRFIASASRDRTSRIWNAATGQVVLSLGGHSDDIVAVAFSPDGTHLATASRDEAVRVWRVRFSAGGDSASSQPLFSLSNQANVVWDVTFSPDGGRLATANTDGTTQIWNAASGRLLLTLAGHTDIVRGVAFSPDGARLATGSQDGTVKIWDVIGHNDVASHVTFSPDGSYLASASQDGTVKVWQLVTGSTEETVALQERFSLPFPSVARRVAISPDSHYLAIAGQDNSPQIWDISAALDTGVVPEQALYSLVGHTDWVFGIAFSPDGSQLATAGDDRLIKIWDARSGKELLTLSGHTSLTSDLDFSPDGKRLATVSNDDSARLWDLETGQEIHRFAHANWVSGVAFSSDGMRLAVVGVDRIADIWDTASGEMLLSLTEHTNWVRDVVFSPVAGDNRLATASYDRTARIWDVTSGQALLTLDSSVEVNSVAFSPDGQFLATAQADGAVHLYVLELDRLVPLAQSRLTRSWRLEECRQYLQLEVCPDGP